MQKITLNLKISPDEYLKLYQGSANSVTATAIDGRSVRFPAKILKPYVTLQGIRGVFVIYFDDQG
ncbi:MAG: DUF2835 domain-containing protein, partial [Motiliproteus sp.]|nr:DUF2835 domain-containing protein [Motiliproteus sp.]